MSLAMVRLAVARAQQARALVTVIKFYEDFTGW